MKKHILELNGAEWDLVADALLAVRLSGEGDPFAPYRMLVKMHTARPGTPSQRRATQAMGLIYDLDQERYRGVLLHWDQPGERDRREAQANQEREKEGSG